MSKRSASSRDEYEEGGGVDFELKEGDVLDEDDQSDESEIEDLEEREDFSDKEVEWRDVDSDEEEESTDGNESYSEEEIENQDDQNKNEDDGKEVEDKEDGAVSRDWDDAEYTDTSDEEELRNTVGNIPMEWYSDYPHLGYDLDGKKIIKPVQGDQLDEFLRKMDDPNYWRTVSDKIAGKEIVLTDRDIDLIERIQNSQYPDDSYDPYTPYEDVYSHEKTIHPLTNRPEPKRRFLPSLWERKKIMKMVKAIKAGSLKPIEKPQKPQFYMLWSESNEAEKLRPHQFIPAPKARLPSHAESYNPPPEFLPTSEQRERNTASKSFLPTKYSSLLQVPAYSHFIKERFERCLDLYLCPRQTRMRIRVDPESLIPKLPKPRELQPFPTTESIVYEGHSGVIRSVDVDSDGTWLASVSDDQTLRLWEVATGRCLKTITLTGNPLSLCFCPSPSSSLIAVAVENSVVLINHGLGDRLVVLATDSTLSSFDGDQSDNAVEWTECDGTIDYTNGFRLTLSHTKTVQQVSWHYKGDYFASVCRGGGVSAVYIHQLSKRRSQNPFRSLKGLVQKVMFHPSRPFFFVATQTYVRVYNLAKQELTKKLSSGVKWISSIAIHPQGDNVIIGSYDKRLCWFDMDLSTKPYKILRHHRQAIRQVCYHPTYPLFASASDDGSVIICHGMVYNDLMQNPLIVPVKVLRAHSSVDTLGVMDCVFHPNQPWVFTAGADGLIKLYS